jgi:hypothetical protein
MAKIMPTGARAWCAELGRVFAQRASRQVSSHMTSHVKTIRSYDAEADDSTEAEKAVRVGRNIMLERSV